MADGDPSLDELKRRQLQQELAERDALAQSETEPEADKHARRADKAHYLREKLSEAERANRDAAREEK